MYADAKGISIDRAMKKIQPVSIKRLDQLFSKSLSLFSKGSVPAGCLAIAVMGRRAKLNGLDAPTKIAPTDPTGEHPADTGAINVNTLSEDTLRRVLRDEKREQDA